MVVKLGNVCGLLLLLLAISCVYYFYQSENIEVNDIYGRYELNVHSINNTIEIRDDTTFIQYLFIDSENIYIDTGYWAFQSDSITVIPDTAFSLRGKGPWEFSTLEHCDYTITFYNFIRRTKEQFGQVPPYDKTPYRNDHFGLSYSIRYCIYKLNDTIYIPLNKVGTYYKRVE